MLEGIRVLEIEGLGPGPFAGMMLSDLGAEVIVVHRKGKGNRSGQGTSMLDRGKRSIELDLKDPDDVNVLKKLVAKSDALVEGFRPGVMERLGLGPRDLYAINPNLVFGRMTGWGQTGPKSQDAGHDLNYIGLSGALWYASPPGQAPFTPPTVVGDIGGGALYLVIGILSGLLRVRSGGPGTVVDAAIVDGSAHMMNLMLSVQSTGLLNPERGRSLLDGPPWSKCYRCADGNWISVQCIESQFYELFLKLMGLQDDAEFKEQFDFNAWGTLSERLQTKFETKSLEEWMRIFENTDACVGPVLEPTEAAAHPHMAHRQSWLQSGGEFQARPAPRFDGNLPALPGPPPKRGEHTDEILGEIAS